MQEGEQVPTQNELSVVRVMLFTLKSLLNPLYLLLSAAAFGGVLWIIFAIEKMLMRYLSTLIHEGHIPDQFKESLVIAHRVLPWFLTGPLLIAVSTYGARVLFLNNGTTPIVPLVRELLVSIKFSIIGYVHALKVVPYFLVPGVAVLLLDQVVDRFISGELAAYGYIALVVIIFAWTIHLSLPICLVPTICACSRYSAYDATQSAYQFYNRHSKQLFPLALVELFGTVGIMLASDALGIDPIVRGVLQTALIFLVFASFAHLAVQFLAVAEFERARATRRYP